MAFDLRGLDLGRGPQGLINFGGDLETCRAESLGGAVDGVHLGQAVAGLRDVPRADAAAPALGTSETCGTERPRAKKFETAER
ncbi:hypothetical protein L3i23_17750 [Herbiconiux sp. L3-i23]|nr:hypothetical protein L3i23_17750 [Herbiconiux sp. L3-i23]